MPVEQVSEYMEEVAIEKNKLNISMINDILNCESFNLFIDSAKDKKISHEYMIRTKWGSIKVKGIFFRKHALLLKNIIENTESLFIDGNEISFLINPTKVKNSGEFDDWYDFEMTFSELGEVFLQVERNKVVYSNEILKGMQKVLTNNRIDFRDYESNVHKWLCGDEIMWKLNFSDAASLVMSA